MRTFRELTAGKTGTIVCLLAGGETKTTRSGRAYGRPIFLDGGQRLAANLWNHTFEETVRRFPIGSVVSVTLTAKTYGGHLVYDVMNLKKGPANVTPDAFLRHPSADPEIMYTHILQWLMKECPGHTAGDGSVTGLVLTLYAQHKPELLAAGAAKMAHGAYRGGLLEHIEAMFRSAVMLYRVYGGDGQYLDKEILYAGVLLHDIGKVVCYKTDPLGETSYEPSEYLEGHILAGIRMIDAEVIRHPDLYAGIEARLDAVRHILASSHGAPDYGAVKRPATGEAHLVALLDQIDAREMEVREGEQRADENGLDTGSRVLTGQVTYRPPFRPNGSDLAEQAVS